MRVHRLKCWPAPFAEVLSGRKRHEVRHNDRGFAAGDAIILDEWDPTEFSAGLPLGVTGRTISFVIGYVSEGGTWGLPPNLCVFTLLEEAR